MVKLTLDHHFLLSRAFPTFLLFIHFFFIIFVFIFNEWIVYFIYFVFFSLHFFVAKIWRLWLLSEVYFEEGKFIVDRDERITIEKEEIASVSTSFGITTLTKVDDTKVYFMLASKSNIDLFFSE